MTPTNRRLHILVVTPGQHPAQVVSRALAYLRKAGLVPDEIHVAAPAAAVLEVQRDLLRNRDGSTGFLDACARTGLSRDEIVFNQRTLHVIDSDGGAPHLEGEADKVLRVLQHVSAGGRNDITVVAAEDAGALGVLAHGALQLIGGPSDRLLMELADHGRPHRRSLGSCLRCVEVPLLLWPEEERPVTSYAEAARRRRTEKQRLERPDVLRLDVRRRTLTIGDAVIRLPAMQFFWMCYLASSAGVRFPLTELSTSLSSSKRPSPLHTQKLDDNRVRSFPLDLQRAFNRVFPMAGDKFDAMFLRSCGPHPGLPSTISKINAALRAALNRGADPYLIQGGRGVGGYRVTLDPALIQIVE